LTRAFLILVRSVKIIEAMFLELLATQMAKSGIENRPALLSEGIGGLEVIETQVWSSTKARLESESGRLVSVIITDERLDMTHRVERTERIAVYDGFLKFKPNWVFVVENKLDHTNVWPPQLSSAFSENYEVEPIPVVITWRDIISRLSLLTENGLVQDAGSTLVDDFLEFVGSEFPELNPYDRFRVCKANLYLLERRCVAIMRQTKLGPVEYHKGWHYSIRLEDKPGIKEVTLYPKTNKSSGWEILLSLNPGDTISQARALYTSIHADKVSSLQAHGWSVSPNFHFAYKSSGLLWMNTRIGVGDYIEYWQDAVRKGELRQISRNDWDNQFGKWQADGLITASDRENIRESIESKLYPTLNVCPGLTFRYTWDSELAVQIDDQSDTAFKRELESKIADALATW